MHEDRVIPRFARYLANALGWTVTAAPDPSADVIYLSGYFESQMCKSWPAAPVAAYFTHREEEPPKNRKAALFDAIGQRVQLRIVTAPMYERMLAGCGPTVRMMAPVERDRFVITRVIKSRRMAAGLSGYTYRSKRKGEDLAKTMLGSKVGRSLEWRASGRGWPVQTRRYSWKEMPAFYQGLDILVCTSRVEGVPMPPLEALSCGVSVVIPRGVGMLDELPKLPGIHRYRRGDAAGLVRALDKAVATRRSVLRGEGREALRAATARYSVANWCEGHREVFAALFGGVDGGLEGCVEEESFMPMEIINLKSKIEGGANLRGGEFSNGLVEVVEEVAGEKVAEGKVAKRKKVARGIYCVAFGDPARTCALRLMKSAKKFMAEIPIALCSDRKIGVEDLLIKQPDSDVGGRRAKLRAYDLTPPEWQAVLYLDADTEVVGDIRFYFQLIEDGWEFVICKDPHLMDTMHSFRRRNNLTELSETAERIHTLHALQYNGGVWAFGRGKRIARFFARWQAEWERHAQRDQGALIRAMYTEPLRTYVLGNEWNTFPKYTKGIRTAGLMHYPGDARRWKGMLPGRIDSPEAWKRVEAFEQQKMASQRRRGK
jgi:hypothetical protein